ncbi:hypothetical protein NDU88_005180 [Pleurodeles waltl]|uniref:Uncharacterized protein n=1 Tax=Pleurodeles waltl TaxID=8319 RepID=A0AAV7M9M5_PLEWA|nr:hypothetical protein NDU88_005180 [Pleurodeles waltl]
MVKHNTKQQKLFFENKHPTRQTDRDPHQDLSQDPSEDDTKQDFKEILIDVRTSLTAIDAKLDLLTSRLDQLEKLNL